jgi:hypothetical protein
MHSTPTLHPFDYLTHLLRAIEALFTSAEALRSWRLLAGAEY